MLHDLATLVQLSPRHLIRALRRSTGFTPYQYVLYWRLQRAKALLRDPTLRIADIAVRVGFTRQEHLSRHFRSQTGLSPTTYRGMLLTRHELRRTAETEAC